MMKVNGILCVTWEHVLSKPNRVNNGAKFIKIPDCLYVSQSDKHTMITTET